MDIYNPIWTFTRLVVGISVVPSLQAPYGLGMLERIILARLCGESSRLENVKFVLSIV